jgi:hypothetical protein
MTTQEMKIMLVQMEKRSNAQAPIFDGRLLDNIEALREMIAESEEIDAITTEREDADFLDSLEED